MKASCDAPIAPGPNSINSRKVQVERKVMLTDAASPPRALPTTPQAGIFTQFALSLQGDGPPPLTLHEACRITEIAIKAQQAADTRSVVSLTGSPYSTA